MNRHDVLQVLQAGGYPSLTITLPTHRTHPENQQDPIRVRNLVSQAQERLLQEFSRREVEPLLDRLARLADAIDYRYALDGLVLFVNKDFAAKFYLPFAVPERVVVADTFLTRDLVFALNRMRRYWVLLLSEQPTRLFAGFHDALVEVTEGGFPMVHVGPGGAAALPGGFGKSVSAQRDARHRQFFRLVDEAFKPFNADDPLPMAVLGVDRYLAFWDEVSAHKNLVRATLRGNYDHMTAHELGQTIWPLVQQAQAEREQQELGGLAQMANQQRVISTLGEVWRMAHEGRGRTLFVEQDYHEAGRLDETGGLRLTAEDAAAPDVIPDVVDEVIEAMISKGGEVVFVGNGELAQYQRIALVLRY